jgi:transcriptional regulator with XRE-family HTH domain
MEHLSFNQRLALIIEQPEVGTLKQLSDIMGYNTPEVINRYLRMKNPNPSLRFLENIVTHLNFINAEWLLTGQGSVRKLSAFYPALAGDRVGRICAVFGLSVNELAELTKKNPAYVRDVTIHPSQGIDLDFFVQILEVFPNISPRWWAFNEGTMLRNVKT